MRILHTADWHLGKKLDHVSRLEEQKLVMEEICSIADRYEVDVVLVAGDIYDSANPSIEAIDVCYKTLKKLANGGRRPVIGIAGNHDSPDRLQASEPLARECGIFLCPFPYSYFVPFKLESGVKVRYSEAGYLELELPQYDYPLKCILTAYANELRLKRDLLARLDQPSESDSGEEMAQLSLLDPIIEPTEDRAASLRKLLEEDWKRLAESHFDKEGVNILMTHLFVMARGEVKPEEPESERPILTLGGASEVYTENFPPQAQYVALGHLHRSQQVGNQAFPIAYSGSPLAYSMSEASQEKFVHIVELKPGDIARVEKVALVEGRELVRLNCESIDEAVDWLKEHPACWVELTLSMDTFLTVEDRKRLMGIHDGIITIIPDIKGNERDISQNRIDLSQNMEDLFKEYFQYKTQQSPNEELIELFKEILAEQDKGDAS